MTTSATHSHAVCPSSCTLCLDGRIVRYVLGFLLLITPLRLQGQCQPTEAKPLPSGIASSNVPAFYDEPQFTVAGVADTTNLGGHGSDIVVRTKEALAKDTASLRKQTQTSNTAPGATAQPLTDTSDFDKAYALAVADATAGKYEESHTRLQTLLTRSDGAEVHHLLGDVEEKLKHPLEAVREYQRAAELSPSEPYLFDWGTELLAHRAPEAAVEVFAKGNRLFPGSVRMLVGMGVAWHARGSYEQATACLFNASDLDPNDPTPYIFLAKMQNADTVQSSAVVEKLARFARIHPESALANYYYASALWKSDKGTVNPDRAARVQTLLGKAIQLDPKLGAAYLQCGIVYSESGNFPQAISAYQQAIAASPEMEEPHYRLAQLYRRVGDKSKAQRELQLYEQLSKNANEKAERERREIQQFVVALRDAKPASNQHEKP